MSFCYNSGNQAEFEHSSKVMTTETISTSNRQPVIRTTTTYSDANPGGDIFGGWLLAQMDVAGGVCAYAYVRNRIVTVGVEAMSFHQPVFIGEEVSFYADVHHVGKTSIAVKIEAWVKRKKTGENVHVTDGIYTYVSIGPDRAPQDIDKTAHAV